MSGATLVALVGLLVLGVLGIIALTNGGRIRGESQTDDGHYRVDIEGGTRRGPYPESRHLKIEDGAQTEGRAQAQGDIQGETLTGSNAPTPTGSNAPIEGTQTNGRAPTKDGAQTNGRASTKDGAQTNGRAPTKDGAQTKSSSKTDAQAKGGAQAARR